MNESDELLTRWMQEADPDRAFVILETLIVNHADPLVRRIVRSRLRPTPDADDVAQKALLALIARLDRMKGEKEPLEVRNFEAYVASLARNACNEYFRSRSPERHRLTLKLRYLARHSRTIALWEMEGRDVCGLTRDRGRPPLEDLSRIDAPSGRVDTQRLAFEDLTAAVLRAAGGPLLFDDLVQVVSAWSNLEEPRYQAIEPEDADEDSPKELADRRLSAEARMNEVEYLRKLWREIIELPLPQRKALLLNLNESIGGDLGVFDYLGIATIEQMAVAIEMPPLAFAELWNQLPLDDARIARDLGISTQAVSNRRSSARQRLSRRMREVPHEKSGKNEDTVRSGVFHHQDRQTR
jgi:RNA polymerase sigma factor (sigma-70 family)